MSTLIKINQSKFKCVNYANNNNLIYRKTLKNVQNVKGFSRNLKDVTILNVNVGINFVSFVCRLGKKIISVKIE